MLAGHPRFRTAPALDSRTLADLHALGGAAFVSDLVEGFLSDTDDVLRALRQATASGDVDTFRDQLHALRSGAANIGAQEIYALCLTWRQIEPAELENRGMGHVDRLAAELDRARADLRRHVAETAEGEAVSGDRGSSSRVAGSGAA
jgi:two-component system sensor histidine kinase RpfC